VAKGQEFHRILPFRGEPEIVPLEAGLPENGVDEPAAPFPRPLLRDSHRFVDGGGWGNAIQVEDLVKGYPEG